MITEFKGEYRFLSNFYTHNLIKVGDITWISAEHAYQAAKSLNPNDWNWIISTPSPSEAKRIGRLVKLRPDWEDIKLAVMKEIVTAKFSQNLNLRDMLLATGTQELVESNNWGDTFWGRCNRVGKNYLGLILMEVREELK